MDYTAMGDTVNVAARLEAATRYQECPILLSESTFLKLPLDMQQSCARLASIEVKGRKERVRLYAPQELAYHLNVETDELDERAS
jgi:adenylate cyclase